MASSARMVTSKVTARSQTTLPAAVRKVLGLSPGSYVGYEIVGDQVRLVNAEQGEHHDPTLDAFLDLLTQSIASEPETIRPIPVSLLQRAMAVTEDIAVDHGACIDGAIDL
jgi:antitoxin PrlF